MHFSSRVLRLALVFLALPLVGALGQNASPILVTAVAILTLVEQEKLNLDTGAFALLPHLTPLPGATIDPRLARITVRQLSQHTGGWDRDARGDPLFKSTEIAAATKTTAPADADAVIRFMLGRPLDFDPGTKYA